MINPFYNDPWGGGIEIFEDDTAEETTKYIYQAAGLPRAYADPYGDPVIYGPRIMLDHLFGWKHNRSDMKHCTKCSPSKNK